MFPSRWTRDLDPLYIYSSSFWRYKTMTHPFLFLRALITSSWARTRHTKKDPTSAENNMLINHFPSSPTDWYARNIPTPKFMTSLCFSFFQANWETVALFLHLRGHISKKIYTHALVIFPLLLYDVVWVRSLAPARKERWEKERKKTSILRGRRRSLIGRASKRKWLPFFLLLSTSFHHFLYPRRGFHHGGGRGENNKKKWEGLRTHREKERKKKRHTKSSRQRKADARLLLSARGDATKKWRSRHFGLGLDKTHFFPFSYPETHKIHLSFSFIIPSLRA